LFQSLKGIIGDCGIAPETLIRIGGFQSLKGIIGDCGKSMSEGKKILYVFQSLKGIIGDCGLGP
jgi:hypothetical protein